MSVGISPELERKPLLGWFLGIIAGAVITVLGVDGFDGQGLVPAGLSLIFTPLGVALTGYSFRQMIR